MSATRSDTSENTATSDTLARMAHLIGNPPVRKSGSPPERHRSQTAVFLGWYLIDRWNQPAVNCPIVHPDGEQVDHEVELAVVVGHTAKNLDEGDVPGYVAGDDFDPSAVDVELRVDGETKQSSNTDQFIFDVQELVAYISQNMTLLPGDVISTGTPGGVGIFRDPSDLLEPGQTCEAEIEGIGTLTNPVVAE